MKKNELIKEMSSHLTGEETPTLTVDGVCKEFNLYISKISFISGLIYLLFLIASLILLEKVDDLAFISVYGYIIMTVIFALFVLIVGIFFSLYIYKDNKKTEFSLNYLKKSYKFYQVFDIVNFIGVFLTIFLWSVLFIITPVEVSGESMEPTFYEEDKILVWHIGYTPQLYDVVIIEANEHYLFANDTEFVIKRIMAKSGDRVSLNSSGVYFINGTAVRQNISIDQFKMMLTDWSVGKTYYEFDEETGMYYGVVPEGYCIALGDNRNNSMDSKSIGLIHNEDVLGKVILRIYPFSKIGIA